MSFTTCWFVARGARPEELRRRADGLVRLYGVGTDALRVVELPELGAIAGAVGLDGRPPDGDGRLTWGTAAGPGAAAEWDDERVELVTAAVDVASLYECGDLAWSTHAAAAVLLARGKIGVRPSALPELLAFGHPVTDGTMVAGVRAVPAATRIVVTDGGIERTSWWPRAKRWALPAEEEAHAAAARAVEAHVAARGAEGVPYLGLTAGLDSRVVALAMRRAGTPFTGFTWGAPGDADVEGGRAVADALGVEHRLVEPVWLDDEEALARSVAEARRSDGAAPFGFAAPSDALPGGIASFTGMGGELGRAFHYAYLARSRREPTIAQVRRVWRPERGLPPGVPREGVAAAADAAVREAAALDGVAGWRILDVVYADLRMRLWGRARIRATAGTFVPVFLHPDVAAALVGLPLEDRLTDGFHRRYLREHGAALAHLPLPPVRGQRGGVPAPVRRAAQAVRSLRRPPATVTTTSLADRPATSEHLRAVLASPLVLEGIGEQSAARLAADLAAGAAAAVTAALALAAPVALA